MTYVPVTSLKVSLDFSGERITVGTLAVNQGKVYFEYDAEFLKRNLHISPFNLQLRPGVVEFERDVFEGLAGVFNDSLPDGWGRLLLDRMLIGQGFVPQQLSPLDRLAYVGAHGMGALVYEPEMNPNHTTPTVIDLDNLAQETQQVLDGESKEVLAQLISLNGSSAGARPKALIGVNADKTHVIHGQQAIPEGYQPWLVKFPNTTDGADAGAIEYIYALMAKDAGLEMMPCHLFPAAQGAGYFATQRFDRVDGKRLHLHSLCGLLHDDFRHPSLDYETVMLATHKLTKDMRERLAIVETMMSEPEKLGNLKKEHTLDMLKTQKIGMDYKFQVDRRVENTIKTKTAKGEIKRHADQVWSTAQKFARDNEYNEFVRAKTPADKLDTRLVKGYLSDQEALKQLVANAPAVALDVLKEKKIDFNGKLRPHQTVRGLQDRATREQEQGKSKTQTRQRTQSRQRGMNI